MVIACFALLFVNFAMTVKNRKEPILFVSVWYACAAVVLTGTTWSGKEAAAAGLVTRMAPAGELEAVLGALEVTA